MKLSLFLIVQLILIFPQESMAKFLKASNLQQQLSHIHGEKKFPKSELEFSGGLQVQAKAAGIPSPVPSGFMGKLVTSWGVFSVLAILGYY